MCGLGFELTTSWIWPLDQGWYNLLNQICGYKLSKRLKCCHGAGHSVTAWTFCSIAPKSLETSIVGLWLQQSSLYVRRKQYYFCLKMMFHSLGAPRLSLTKYSRDHFSQISLTILFSWWLHLNILCLRIYSTRLHASLAKFFCDGYI